MPVIRNPFRRSVAPSALAAATVAEQPNSADGSYRHDSSPKVATSAITILKNDEERNSYKMSVVNDSGVYLPPSPPEKKAFWRRDNTSSSSKNRPPLIPPDEPFTISRESFDSYRRSFDISARSPISEVAPRNSFDARPIRERVSMDVRPSRMSLDVAPSRMSLDSRPAPSRLSLDQRPSSRFPQTVPDEGSDDGFEEVKLDDPRPAKRHSLFSRFGSDAPKDLTRPRSGIFSRKELTVDTAHESELGSIDRA